MILVPLFDLKFLNDGAARDAGTSNRRRWYAPPCRGRLRPLFQCPPEDVTPDVNRSMNLQNDAQSLALMKFGIGQPVLRTEDPVLLRGEGRYTDDVKLAGEAYAVIVRSRIAHGVIKSIGIS